MLRALVPDNHWCSRSIKVVANRRKSLLVCVSVAAVLSTEVATDERGRRPKGFCFGMAPEVNAPLTDSPLPHTKTQTQRKTIMATKVRPFADQGYFTSVHNALFDAVMPNIKATSWKILCAIIRATDGWNKAREEISFKKLKELTGINTNHTLLACLKELQDYSPPLIEIEVGQHGKDFKASSYRLNKSAQIEWKPGAKNAPAPGAKNAPAPGAKNAPAPGAKNAPLPNINHETIETIETTLLAAPRAEKKKTPKTSPKEKPPSNPNHHHPMVDLYREVSGYNALTKIQCDEIAAHVTDETAWREILKERNLRGWKGHNVKRALVEYERAAQGETIEQIYRVENGNGKQHYETKGERNARNTFKMLERLGREAESDAHALNSGDAEASEFALILRR